MNDSRPRIMLLIAWWTGLSVVGTTYGAEGPVVSVTVNEVDTIYTATMCSSSESGFKPHINFPWMEQRGDGSLFAWWTVGQTQSSAHFGLSSQSFDGGDNWYTPTSSYTVTPPVAMMKPGGQTSLGFEVNYSTTSPITVYGANRYSSTDGGYNWSATGTAVYNLDSAGFVNLYQQQGPVVEAGGELFFTAYGQRTTSSSTYETILFASDDGGANWDMRSSISAYVPGLNASMGDEGPTETALIELDNGDLLAVFRTGQPYPNNDINSDYPSIFRSISSDGGYTWSTPKMLGVMGVSPHLNKLPDGQIAMTYGRYGIQMIFADETGTRWSEPYTLLNDSTSGHTRMYERSDGDWVIAYDHSSFYHPSQNANPPAGYVLGNDQSGYMKIANLTITPQTVSDNWDFEYHGDVSPEDLVVPWTYASTGSPSIRLWADQGQDYIRIDTGTTGTSRSAYYTLNGSATSSAWDDVDFSDGFTLEMRARVGSSTTDPSAATLLLGDGQSGFIALELTDDYVGLEGLNGNSGQVNHTASGFSTLDWHHYRLVINTDSQTSLVTARLYIDGNWTTPILTQLLNSTVIDEIAFGDLTGTNNGVLDLDFIRFAYANPVPGSGTITLFGIAACLRRRMRSRKPSRDIAP